MEDSYRVKLTANYLAGSYAVGASQVNTIENLMSELNFEGPIHVITEVKPRPERQSGGQSAGRVVSVLDICIVMPIAVFLAAFVKSFGSKLGEQSAEAVSRAFSAWLKRAHETYESSWNKVSIVDEKERIIVHLPKNLPPEAYYELVKVVNEIPKRRFRRRYIVLSYHWPNGPGRSGWR